MIMASNSAQIRLDTLGFHLDGSPEPKEAFDKLWVKHHPPKIEDVLKLKATEVRDDLWELIWRFRCSQ